MTEWNLPKKITEYDQMFPLNMWDSGFITWIDIEEAISLYPSKNYNYSKRSLKRIEERMKKGEILDPLFIGVNITDNCLMDKHEGRHRLVVAKKLGLKKVPVLIEFWERDKHGDNWLVHEKEKGLNNACVSTSEHKNNVPISCVWENCFLTEVKLDKMDIQPQWKRRGSKPLRPEIKELFEQELKNCREGIKSEVYGDFFCNGN